MPDDPKRANCRYPFPLPVGWFRVAFEADWAPGRAGPLHYFGRELVLWRSQSGVACIAEAHCPHLGAHLGHGGEVVGESLRCPFHAWRYGSDGACIDVPYAKRIPPNARLRTWPCEIRHGVIWAWHGAGPPVWPLPEIPEVDDADWTPFRHHRWRVHTCNQEIAENTVDPIHFAAVHGFPAPTEPEIDFEGPRYRSLTRYRVPGPDGRAVDSSLDVRWHGLGIGTSRSSGALDLLFLGTLTPVNEGELDVCFSFSVCAARGLDPERGAGRAFIAEAIRQMEQDIPIWEHKRFWERPVLSDGDGPIPRFRAWAAQFYSGVDA